MNSEMDLLWQILVLVPKCNLGTREDEKVRFVQGLSSSGPCHVGLQPAGFKMK
jgi:hypothetical protein